MPMEARLPSLSVSELDGYLERIALRGPLAPDARTLAALHFAHATHLPFENLDILLGRGIRLDADSVYAKLVTARRGGYCFEQNLLFARVLQTIGYPLTMLAARVRYRTTRILPRTHMLLLAEADGERWVADVGFGGEGLLLPVRLESGAPSVQHAWTYRLAAADGGWLMQASDREGWHDLYAFTLEPQLPVDYEVANHYVSTHPNSRFVRTLAAQLPGPVVRQTLANRVLTTERGFEVETRALASDDDLLDALATVFGLPFPAGTRFRFDDANA
jgi:N-hydroxyarylamine O-acetyltransferase